MAQISDLETRLRAAVGASGNESSDFDLNPDVVLSAGRTLRPAAVLIAVSVGKVPTVLLTKRSSALKHHPGQIAFPGGKVDAGDTDATGAALREAREEVGLPESLPRVVGRLPAHETVTGFSVTPVLALLESHFDPVIEPREVEDVFQVPLTHVLEPDNFLIQHRRWRGQKRHYFTIPWGPYYIWGATARMLYALAMRMRS